MESKEMSFLAAARDFFGLKSGQTSIQFAAEVKELTDVDRQEIKQGLEANGYKLK